MPTGIHIQIGNVSQFNVNNVELSIVKNFHIQRRCHEINIYEKNTFFDVSCQCQNFNNATFHQNLTDNFALLIIICVCVSDIESQLNLWANTTSRKQHDYSNNSIYSLVMNIIEQRSNLIWWFFFIRCHSIQGYDVFLFSLFSAT